MHRLIIALTTLLGLTAAAYLAGYILLFSGLADRAAGLVPANAAVYATVYLQPSTGQQVNLAGLIGRLPGFADEASLDDKVDEAVQNLLAGAGVDYRVQIKPWLGDQVAAAAWYADDDAALQHSVAILTLTDEAAARASIEDLAPETETFTSEEYGGTTLHVASTIAYAVIGDMLVLSATSEAIRGVIDTQGGGPDLASREEFGARMAELPSDHLAAGFVDVAALTGGSGEALQGTGLLGTAGVALVAERDGIRLSATMPQDTRAATASEVVSPEPVAGASTLTDWMPAETVAEAVVFNLDDTIAAAEAGAASVPEAQALTQAMDTLRVAAALGLGIDLNADVMPLLSGEVGLAIGAAADGVPSGQLILRPDDPEAGAATLERIAERLADAGGERRTESVGDVEVTVVVAPQIGQFAFLATDGVLVLGLSVADVVAAVDAHADGPSLAAHEPYRRALALTGELRGSEVYADVGPLLDLLGVPDTLPEDARAILARIGSFSSVAGTRNGHIEIQAVLTIDEVAAE